MARPQKEGLDYFPHDVDASGDPKIEPLIILYGSKGYGFYFMHLEYIYRTPDLMLDVSDAETREIFCNKLKINQEEYQQILNTALKHGCFDKELFSTSGILTSNGIKKRAGIVIKKRQEMQQRYQNRLLKQSEISVEETKEETTPETPQSKVKKSKEKKSINNNNIYTAEFESFYSEYPRPEDKRRSFNNWKTCLKAYSVDQLMTACRNYKKLKANTQIEFIKTSANFLGKEKPFEDYLGSKPAESKSRYIDQTNYEPR